MNKKIRNADIYYNEKEPGNKPREKKSDTKNHIWRDSIYMKHLT